MVVILEELLLETSFSILFLFACLAIRLQLSLSSQNSLAVSTVELQLIQVFFVL